MLVQPDDVAEAARFYLEERPALPREDCSGLVEAIHALAGQPLSGSVRTMWAQAVEEGRVHDEPRPGDVVFFDDTFDADDDGRADDELTHVAVVVDIERDGTIVMVHRARTAGIEPIRMNLERPSVYKDGDLVLNDHLAVRGWANRDGGRLTGQLLHGFASFADEPAPRARGTADEPSAPIVTRPDRDGTALGVVVAGRRLRGRDLVAVSCAELDDLRDAVYARHGYVFRDAARNAPFGGRAWYAPDPDMPSAEVVDHLTGADRFNLDVLASRAGRCGT